MPAAAGGAVMMRFFAGLFKGAAHSALYALTGALACFSAFFIAVHFMAPAFSRQPPPSPGSGASEKKPPSGLIESLKETAGEFARQGTRLFSSPPKGSPAAPKPPQLEGQIPGASAPAGPAAPASEAGAAAAGAEEISPQGQFLKFLIDAAAGISGDASALAGKKPRQHYEQPPDVEVEAYVVPFIYESSNRRNPFDDPTMKQTEVISATEVVEKFVKPRTPLEEYPLSELKIMALAWNTKKPKALVQVPDGAFYTVIRGDKIGRTGAVYDIREDELLVVERIGNEEDGEAENEIKILKMDRLRL